jgi:hypothetical protein
MANKKQLIFERKERISNKFTVNLFNRNFYFETTDKVSVKNISKDIDHKIKYYPETFCNNKITVDGYFESFSDKFLVDAGICPICNKILSTEILPNKTLNKQKEFFLASKFSSVDYSEYVCVKNKVIRINMQKFAFNSLGKLEKFSHTFYSEDLFIPKQNICELTCLVKLIQK